MIANHLEKPTCFPHKIYCNLIFFSYILLGKIGENVYCLVLFYNMAFSGKRSLSILILPQIIQDEREGHYSVLLITYDFLFKVAYQNFKDSKWKT